MSRKQISISELFPEVKEAEKAHELLFQILDKYSNPSTPEEVSAISLEMANALSRKVFDLYEAQTTVGIELEYINGNPKIAIFESNSCDCG